MDMDGSMSVGRRPADRESVGGRRSVSLPSRYIEELENCSSPGVVSKKAAYFEEVIRSASSEKCPPSTNRKTGTGRRSMDRVDEAVVTEYADVTARTLDFYSDSELDFESKEIEGDLASELGGSDGIPENAIHPEQDDSSCVDNESSVSEPLGENLHFRKLDETGLVDDGVCHVQVEKFSEGGNNLDILGPLETQTEVLKENKDEKEHDDSALPEANSLEVKKNLGSSTSMSKVPVTQIGKLPTRVSIARLEKKKAGEGTLRCGAEGIIPKRGVPRSVHPVSRSTSFTVPQPFALATDKRKSFGGRLTSEDTKTNLKSTAGSADRSSTRKSQVGTKTASKPSLKDLRSSVKPEGQVHKESSPASVSANGIPRGANGFHLKSDERAEKRKEFYTKLEERVTAREHERNQMKAKTQEETEAELRKLRQSLRFKAKPLPSFYHEMPQTKNDLKKAPTTRAISPRLGRPKCNSTEGSHIRLCQQHTPSDPPRAGPVSIKKNSPEKASSSSEGGPQRGKPPAEVGSPRTSFQKHGSPSPVNVAKGNVSEASGVGVPSEGCSSLLGLKEENLVNGNDPEVGLSSEDCFDLKEEDDLLPGYGAEADIVPDYSSVAVKVAEYCEGRR